MLAGLEQKTSCSPHARHFYLQQAPLKRSQHQSFPQHHYPSPSLSRALLPSQNPRSLHPPRSHPHHDSGIPNAVRVSQHPFAAPFQIVRLSIYRERAPTTWRRVFFPIGLSDGREERKLAAYCILTAGEGREEDLSGLELVAEDCEGHGAARFEYDTGSARCTTQRRKDGRRVRPSLRLARESSRATK